MVIQATQCTDPVVEFRAVVEGAGLVPSEIIPDGELRRCPTADKPRSKDGWVVLYGNPIAGAYGNWTTGETGTWSDSNNRTMDSVTRRRLHARIEEAKKERENEEARKHEQAAGEARKIIDSLPEAISTNPYLARKGVKSCPGLRADGNTIVVPLLDAGGRVVSLQRIEPDGSKKFHIGGRTRGGYFPVKSNHVGLGPIIVCEGIATGLTIHEAVPAATVLVSFTAGNLQAVATVARRRYPDGQIIVAGDDDKATEKKTGRNPGRAAAEAAARAVNGLVVLPVFETGEVGTDYNDLHKSEGLQAVINCLDAATRPGPTHDPFDDWSDPIPLPDGLPPVAPFDDALLPEILQPWASDITDRMQCPPDYVAVAIVAAAGAVIGRKITVRPQASTDWTVTPNQWALLIGRPGFLKSPAMEAALAPVKRLVALAVENYQEQIKEYATAKAVGKLKMEAAEKAARVELKNNPRADVSALLAVDLAEEPTMRRYIANDTTAAALGELHRQNPNGLLVFRDELVSLLKMLDQEENSEARGFYLTGWNGDSPYTFDRITRGMNLSIPAVCLSMLGSTQPARIAQYVKGAVSGTGDDGLLQRFGLLVWPDATASWKEIDRWPDSEAKRAAFDVFDRLDRIVPSTIGAQQDTGLDGGPDGSPYLRFAPEGLGLFREWRQDLEIRLRAGDLHPALESHFAKYRKLVPGLALIFHLTSGSTGPIRGRAVLQALAWSEYLATHARRLYASITAPEVSTAKAILKKIRQGDLSTVLTVRQVWRPQWSGLTDLNAIKEGVALLVDFGWMRKTRVDTGGRPAEVYETHPRVVEVTG